MDSLQTCHGSGADAVSIDYTNVRTNWNVYPPSSTCESVMVTRRQVVTGVISIPLKRCLHIFGALHEGGEGACMDDGATGVSLVGMMSPFSSSSSNYVSIENENKDEGKEKEKEEKPRQQQRGMKKRHTNPDAGHTVVVWNSDCTKGYQVHMRRYTSQPTQVFLQSLHACFHEMQVRPRSVLCFVPLGIQGHCQLYVWHDGDPHHRAFKSSIVHGWTQQRTEGEPVSNDDEILQTALDVPMPHPLPIKTCDRGDGEVACMVHGHFVLDPLYTSSNVVIVMPATMPKRLLDAKKKKKEKEKSSGKSLDHSNENATNENTSANQYNSSSWDHSSMKMTQSTENTNGRKRSRKPFKPNQGHQM